MYLFNISTIALTGSLGDPRGYCEEEQGVNADFLVRLVLHT